MNYSSAWFERPTVHGDAQHAKVRRALRMAGVKPGDRVLEIGCGWGALAEKATTEFDASIVGVTLSTEQLAGPPAGERTHGPAGRARAGAPTCGCRTTATLPDAPFDAICSIEMVEAVGREYWPTYFQAVQACSSRAAGLHPEHRHRRRALRPLHEAAPTSSSSTSSRAAACPAPASSAAQAAKAGLEVVDEFAFGQDYARTLRCGASASCTNSSGAATRFRPASCASGSSTWRTARPPFTGRSIDVVQYTLKKKQTRLLKGGAPSHHLLCTALLLFACAALVVPRHALLAARLCAQRHGATPEPTVQAALQGKAPVGKARLRVWGFRCTTPRCGPGRVRCQRFAEQRFALELSYLRSFKGATSRNARSTRCAAGRLDGPTGRSRWLQAMSELFPDVKRGDRITGVHVPGSGARFYLNGRLLGDVATRPSRACSSASGCRPSHLATAPCAGHCCNPGGHGSPHAMSADRATRSGPPLHRPGAWRHGLRYGLLGLPLAFVALPLYVILPNHYAPRIRRAAGALGAVLLGARLVDAVLDPWIGRWCDRLFARSHRTPCWAPGAGRGGAGAGPVGPAVSAACRARPGTALLGGPGCSWPLPTPRTAWWRGAPVLGRHAGRHRGSAQPRGRLARSAGPGGRAAGGGAARHAGLGATVGSLCRAAGAGLVGLDACGRPPAITAPPPDRARGTPAAPARSCGCWPCSCSTAPPARCPPRWCCSLCRTGCRRRPMEPAFPGHLLPVRRAVHSAVGAAGGALGLARTWLAGMGLAVAVFVWAATLGAGDTAAFLIVCALSGMALGTDLALPSAMLAGLIGQLGERGQREGAYFGWWSFAAKLNLALAAGLALPLLAWFGYTPGSRDPKPCRR
jgi:glycoside/pentoside/hexuronide:cation symporter, GPH family